VSRRGLVTPRGSTGALADYGARPTVIARQRVRRVRPRPPAGRRRSRRAWALGLGLALLAAAGTVGGGRWLLTSPRFAVGTVEVRGADRVEPERVRAAAGIVPGTNIFRIDPAVIAARVQGLPGIRRVDVVRELPNRVTVLVEERRPFTLVSAGRLHWVDEDGRWLGVEDRAVTPPVPVISGLPEDELAGLRSEPGPRARAALALIRALLRAGSPLAGAVSEIDMSGREGPVLYTVDGIEVRLGGEDWEERLARLEGVLAQLAQDGAEVKSIDLRFRDQVVLTKGGRG
jgi:cell division protein FtsQ